MKPILFVAILIAAIAGGLWWLWTMVCAELDRETWYDS